LKGTAMQSDDMFGNHGTKVSAASARLMFTECGPACIEQNGCLGKCCDAPTRPSGCMVTVHATERPRIEALGAVVEGGFIQPRAGERGCPFKVDGLCSLHATAEKPFGCVASPFTLNKSGTLIVRNRYKMLPCYRGSGAKAPAYQVFRSSLDLIFGAQEAARVCAHLEGGGGDIYAEIPAANYAILTDNDQAKRTENASS
jgi:hypothetical protein